MMPKKTENALIWRYPFSCWFSAACQIEYNKHEFSDSIDGPASSGVSFSPDSDLHWNDKSNFTGIKSLS